MGGTYRQQGGWWRQGAPDGGIGALTGPWMHHLYIQRCWLAPNGGCEASTCQNLAGKAVPRSVGASECMTVGRWIRVNSISSIGANRLESTLGIASGVAPMDH